MIEKVEEVGAVEIMELVKEKAKSYAIGLVDDTARGLDIHLKKRVEDLVSLGYIRGWIDRTMEATEDLKRIG